MNEARKKKVDEWRERLISREMPHRRDSVIEAMQPGGTLSQGGWRPERRFEQAFGPRRQNFVGDEIRENRR